MKKYIVFFLTAVLSVAVGAGEMISLGSQASEIEVKKWVHQNPVSLKQYKDKKVVVLFFWSLDNASIMAFRPLAELTKQVKGDKIAWIGIASGDEKNIANFKLTKVLPFPVAVDNGNTVKKYMPPKVKYPACAIISQDGRLAWRGTVRNMPLILKKLLSGKLDVNEIARKEQFNISLGRAVKEKKYQEAIALIEKEQLVKFSPELVTLQVQLLLEAKESAKATKLLDDTINAHPELPGPHLLRQMVYRSFFKDENKAIAAGSDSVNKLKSHPRVLADLLQNEMKLSVDQRSPEFIFMMANALKEACGKLSGREKANMLLVYAQAMNMCSFNTLAESAALEAEKLFTDIKEQKTAEMLKKYYQRLIKLEKQQKITK